MSESGQEHRFSRGLGVRSPPDSTGIAAAQRTDVEAIYYRPGLEHRLGVGAPRCVNIMIYVLASPSLLTVRPKLSCGSSQSIRRKSIAKIRTTICARQRLRLRSIGGTRGTTCSPLHDGHDHQRQVEMEIQGASVLATRKPTSLSPMANQSRMAARRYLGVRLQEPPRTTWRPPQFSIVRAEPSEGAPLQLPR